MTDTTENSNAPAVGCTRLLACPFCGGEAVMEEIEAMGNWRKSAGCKTEGCQGYQSSVTFATHREATEAWNKRSIIEQLKRQRIYTDGRRMLHLALEQMTDEWIDAGQYCDQTIMDLRDALRVVLQANEKGQR